MSTVRLTTGWQHTRGVIGRYPAPGDQVVLEFDAVAPRLIHMVGVRRPLRVEWHVNDRLQASETLQPWVGWGRYRANRVVERRPET